MPEAEYFIVFYFVNHRFEYFLGNTFILWEFHTIYFEHTHTLSTLLSFPIQLRDLFHLFFTSIELSLYCPATLACAWPMRCHSIKDKWLSLTQWLSNAIRDITSGGSYAYLHCLCWDSVCLELVQVLCLLSQWLWAHVYNCPIVLGKQK